VEQVSKPAVTPRTERAKSRRSLTRSIAL